MSFLKNNCSKHIFTKACGSCSICEKLYCDKCLEDHLTYLGCKTHINIIKNGEWILYKSAKSNPTQPEDGLILYNLKNKIWKNFKLPSLLTLDYQEVDGPITTISNLYILKSDLKDWEQKEGD